MIAKPNKIRWHIKLWIILLSVNSVYWFICHLLVLRLDSFAGGIFSHSTQRQYFTLAFGHFTVLLFWPLMFIYEISPIVFHLYNKENLRLFLLIQKKFASVVSSGLLLTWSLMWRSSTFTNNLKPGHDTVTKNQMPHWCYWVSHSKFDVQIVC